MNAVGRRFRDDTTTRWRSVRTSLALALLLPGAALLSHAADAPVAVRGVLSPPEIPFHRISRYEVVVDAPEGTAIEIPPWPDSLPGLDVSFSEPVVLPQGAGTIRLTQAITLRPTRPAIYVLPATIVRANGNVVATPTPGELRVRDLTPEEELEVAAPQDFMTLADVHGNRAWRYRITAAIVVLALAAIGGYWAVRRGSWAWPRIKRPLDPGARALQRIAAAKDDDGLQGPEVVYLELSGALRDYLEDQFGVPARELSTPEFVDGPLAELPIRKQLQTDIEAILVESDRVKYAQHRPDRERQDAAAGAADALVRALIAASAEAATQPAAGAQS